MESRSGDGTRIGEPFRSWDHRRGVLISDQRCSWAAAVFLGSDRQTRHPARFTGRCCLIPAISPQGRRTICLPKARKPSSVPATGLW